LIYDKLYSSYVATDGNWEITITDKLSDGMHNVKLFQIDVAGNVSSNVDLSFKIDTSVPAAPVVLYPEKDGYVNTSDFTFRGTGEPDATISCNLAGLEYEAKVKDDASWSVDIINNENIKYAMPYSLSVKQTDLAGNTGTSAKVEFRVDPQFLQAPEMTYPCNQSEINTLTPVITGIGKTGATIELRINDQKYTAKVAANNAWSVSPGKSCVIGENTIYAYQTQYGNISPECRISFNINLYAPAAPQILYPAENQSVSSQNLAIKGTGAAFMSINIKLDDKCFSTAVRNDGNWEYVIGNELESGKHSLLVSQTDAAGNVSAYSNVCFTINNNQQNALLDGSPVNYQVSYNPDGPDWTTKAIATLRTSKPVTICNVYGTVFSKIISDNGVYEYEFTDVLGNHGAVSAAVTWIDNNQPIIQILPNGNQFSADNTINYYKLCGSGIRYALLNGNQVDSGTKVVEEGMYKVEISDMAGNVAVKEFIIDRTSPDVYGAANQQVYTSDVTITYSDNLSGIKSAALNGKNILSGAIISQSGDYTLTVTDFGNNITERKFKLQK